MSLNLSEVFAHKLYLSIFFFVFLHTYSQTLTSQFKIAVSNKNNRLSPSSKSTPNNETMVSFSEDEITSLRLLFQFMDRNCTGYLTKDMILANGEDGGDYIDTFELDTFFEVVDADDDEKIGIEEFLLFAHRLKKMTSSKNLLTK